MEEDNNDVLEWEFLPENDGFLQIHHDHLHTGNKIFSRRYAPPYHNQNHNHLFVTNYFVFPSVRSSLNLADPTTDPKQIHLDSPSDQISLEPPTSDLGGAKLDDDETVSQVSFKKLKLDSPKTISTTSSGGGRAVLPLIQYELEEASEILTNEDDTTSDHPKNSSGGGGGGLNAWKRNLTGLGAICSFGVVAAATFCFIVLGIQRKNNKGESKLQFQIFSDDKVHHHKNSISMPVSVTGAHITFNLEC